MIHLDSLKLAFIGVISFNPSKYSFAHFRSKKFGSERLVPATDRKGQDWDPDGNAESNSIGTDGDE